MTFYTNSSRRQFLRQSALGAGIGLFATSAFSLSALYDRTYKPEKKLGVALVGLGGYSAGQLAPALQSTQFCELRGIVTGTPSKVEEWKKKYNIADKNVYNYENFDKIADNPDIDIVYIVLPNSMHAEYTIRAAEAGKHVICEKPMAVSVEECEKMIAACKKNKRKLQIGYRLHYEPHNMELMRLGREKVFGAPKIVETSNAFYASDSWDNWRFHKELSGGGPLMDMGIYSIQGARYALGQEPISVTAQATWTRPDKFKDVEETLFWQMEFPDGVFANCMTSYSARVGNIHVYCEKGNYGLEPAYGYGQIKGYINDKPMEFPQTVQQAVQMDAFTRNILDDTENLAPAEDGMQDVRIIEAIYKAMESGERVKI